MMMTAPTPDLAARGADPAPVVHGHTSVPREDDRASLDGARHLVRIGFMGAPALTVDLPKVPVTELSFPSGNQEWSALDEAMVGARVGLRVLIVGTEADAFAARARVLSHGAVDEEITTLVTDRDTRRVYCAHCRRRSAHVASIGDVVICPSCTRNLIIYHHFSRTLAAYLGYMVDAEDPT